VTHHIARNQVDSGVRVSWKIVPAVTDAWWPQGGTLEPDAANRPRLPQAALWTAEALRPPELRQVRPTRVLGCEPPVELGLIPRIILHGAGHYMLGSPESSK
jgi:hypothetical protein